MTTLVVPREAKFAPHSSLLTALGNGCFESLLADAGLPASIEKVQGCTLIFARKGFADDTSRIATVTSIEFSRKRKVVTLELSAHSFLVSERPVLQYEAGKWYLYMHGANEHKFDDIEFALL